MGNQRRFERHLRAVSDPFDNNVSRSNGAQEGQNGSRGRPSTGSRVTEPKAKAAEKKARESNADAAEKEAEDAELMENLIDDWFNLTDDLVASLADHIDAAMEDMEEDEDSQDEDLDEDEDDEEDFLIGGLDTMFERYGVEGVILGAALASRYLVEHILAHGETVTGIEDALGMMPSLSATRLRTEALSLAEAIVAEAGGIRDCAVRAATKLTKKKLEDALTVTLSVWQAFCFLGSTHDIAISWCDEEVYEDEEDDGLEEDPYERLQQYVDDYLFDEDEYAEEDEDDSGGED